MADYIKSNDYMLYLPNERLKTFKSWPLGFDCNCTPDKVLYLITETMEIGFFSLVAWLEHFGAITRRCVIP